MCRYASMWEVIYRKSERSLTGSGTIISIVSSKHDLIVNQYDYKNEKSFISVKGLTIG